MHDLASMCPLEYSILLKQLLINLTDPEHHKWQIADLNPNVSLQNVVIEHRRNGKFQL